MKFCSFLKKYSYDYENFGIDKLLFRTFFLLPNIWHLVSICMVNFDWLYHEKANSIGCALCNSFRFTSHLKQYPKIFKNISRCRFYFPYLLNGLMHLWYWIFPLILLLYIWFLWIFESILNWKIYTTFVWDIFYILTQCITIQMWMASTPVNTTTFHPLHDKKNSTQRDLFIFEYCLEETQV